MRQPRGVYVGTATAEAVMNTIPLFRPVQTLHVTMSVVNRPSSVTIVAIGMYFKSET